MKRKKLQVVVGCIFLMLMAGIVASGIAHAQPIEISWVSFIPKLDPSVDGIVRGLMNRVIQKGKGEVVFKYRGGPETIAAFDQGKAVQKGVVDLAIVPVGFYEPLAPGIGGSVLTQISLEEERRPGGGYDFLNELHKKGGLFYLGRGNPSDGYFVLNLRKKLEKPQDFVGARIGTTTVARAVTAAWGATPITLSMPEYYSSMERGLVDGVSSCPLSQWVAQGAHEVTKYSVDHGYYQSTVAVFMNLEKWNRVPKHLQNLMMESMIQSEKDNITWEIEYKNKARERMVKAGVQFYKFSPEVAKWFTETAYNSYWEYQQKRFPDVTPKLRELLSKK